MCNDPECVTCLVNAGCMSMANPHCKDCSGLGWKYGIDNQERTDYSKVILCPGENCSAFVHAERQSGLQSKVQTFDTFKHRRGTKTEEAYNVCQDFLNTDNRLWLLLLLGDVGVGKTHLANAVKHSVKTDVMLFTGFGFFSYLKSGIDDKTLNDKTVNLKLVTWLIIDDLKMELITEQSPWHLDILEEIVDTRYAGGHKTMVTTNASMADITSASPRLADRFRDKTYSKWLLLDGQSKRSNVKS